MSKVNWSKVISLAVKNARSKGSEANITQARNIVNDLCQVLVDRHTAGEIVDGVLKLAEDSREFVSRK